MFLWFISPIKRHYQSKQIISLICNNFSSIGWNFFAFITSIWLPNFIDQLTTILPTCEYFRSAFQAMHYSSSRKVPNIKLRSCLLDKDISTEWTIEKVPVPFFIISTLHVYEYISIFLERLLGTIFCIVASTLGRRLFFSWVRFLNEFRILCISSSISADCSIIGTSLIFFQKLVAIHVSIRTFHHNLLEEDSKVI